MGSRWSGRQRVRESSRRCAGHGQIELQMERRLDQPATDHRRLDVFFYGLFMDEQLLRAKGIHPADARIASVPGFVLRIGARATLVPAPGAEVHGVLMKLSHADLETLYGDASVQAYRPEAVLAMERNGAAV